MKMSPAKKKFVEIATEMFGEKAILNRSMIEEVKAKHGLGHPSWFMRPEFKASPVSRGEFRLPSLKDEENVTMPSYTVVAPAVTEKVVSSPASKKEVEENIENYVPGKDSNYVKFGHYNDLKTIVKSGMFYPVFITGLSGNGKTFMVEQVCAEAKKEMLRVNITIETDEDDMIGHYGLATDPESGQSVTKWQDGPVVKAMERGAVLLLDEIDLASSKVMCLQPVLEGKPILIKKENRVVYPAAGFNVVSTANTKGKGSDDGRFVFTNVLNEAFLERFPITLEQEYPAVSTEKKILNKVLESLGGRDEDFTAKLVDWADMIRKTFYDGGIDELIATRRLVHIIHAFAIFRDRMKAITMCVNRFDEETKTTFLDLYTKVDEEAIKSEETEAEEAHRMLDEESETEEVDHSNHNPF